MQRGRDWGGGRAPSGFGMYSQAGIRPGSSKRGFVRKDGALLGF